MHGHFECVLTRTALWIVKIASETRDTDKLSFECLTFFCAHFLSLLRPLRCSTLVSL